MWDDLVETIYRFAISTCAGQGGLMYEDWTCWFGPVLGQ